jgi:hypothetical protein
MNTRYVLWCDSWAEVQQLHLRFGPHEHWRNIPASELPSMGRYIATHSLGQMAWREVRGLAELVGNCMIGHGYAPFFLLLFFFGLALLIQCPELRAKVIRYRDPSWLGWFAIPYFGAHLVMLGFYGVVGAGERFSLAMFLPAMYAMTRAFVGVAGPEHRVRIGALELDWTAFQWAFFALAIVQIVTYWPVAMMTHYAGG